MGTEKTWSISSSVWGSVSEEPDQRRAGTYELLGLTQEAEDHEPGDQVQPSVEAERTGLGHDGGHTREGKTKDTSEGVVDAHSPGHALLTVDGGKDLGTVLESDWSLTERVCDGEEVDKEYDGTDASATAQLRVVVEERQTSGQEEDAHQRERDEAERSSTLGIDEEQCGDGEDDLDRAVAERSVKGLCGSVTNLLEDRGRVERDDVDTAHLLGKHDRGSAVVGASNAGNGEAVAKTAEVVAVTGDTELFCVDDVGVVVIAGRNDLVSAQLVH